MPSEDQDLMRGIDMAVSHVIVARFGRMSPRARAGLYRAAAGLFEKVAEMLWERSHADDELGRAEEMMKREKWQAL